LDFGEESGETSASAAVSSGRFIEWK